MAGNQNEDFIDLHDFILRYQLVLDPLDNFIISCLNYQFSQTVNQRQKEVLTTKIDKAEKFFKIIELNPLNIDAARQDSLRSRLKATVFTARQRIGLEPKSLAEIAFETLGLITKVENNTWEKQESWSFTRPFMKYNDIESTRKLLSFVDIVLFITRLNPTLNLQRMQLESELKDAIKFIKYEYDEITQRKYRLKAIKDFRIRPFPRSQKIPLRKLSTIANVYEISESSIENFKKRTYIDFSSKTNDLIEILHSSWLKLPKTRKINSMDHKLALKIRGKLDKYENLNKPDDDGKDNEK